MTFFFVFFFPAPTSASRRKCFILECPGLCSPPSPWPASLLSSVVEERKHRGVPVETVSWFYSPWVEHLKQEKMLYLIIVAAGELWSLKNQQFSFAIILSPWIPTASSSLTAMFQLQCQLYLSVWQIWTNTKSSSKCLPHLALSLFFLSLLQLLLYWNVSQLTVLSYCSQTWTNQRTLTMLHQHGNTQILTHIFAPPISNFFVVFIIYFFSCHRIKPHNISFVAALKKQLTLLKLQDIIPLLAPPNIQF